MKLIKREDAMQFQVLRCVDEHMSFWKKEFIGINRSKAVYYFKKLKLSIETFQRL